MKKTTNLTIVILAIMMSNIAVASNIVRYTTTDNKSIMNLAARRRRASGHRRPTSGPVRHAAPQKAIRHRTIHGRRMRWYAAGSGVTLVAGATCYVDGLNFGRISGNNCCIHDSCHRSFYID